MKQFISAHDVANIPALINTALAYKANPRKDEQLGKHKRHWLPFLESKYADKNEHSGCRTTIGHGSYLFSMWAVKVGHLSLKMVLS